jgi:hypothetical protein
MARLTKTESEAKKTRIAALLASNTPWAKIVKDTRCSFQTIAKIHNGSDNRSDKKSNQTILDPGMKVENEALKATVTELYSFFKKVIADPKRMDAELDNLDITVIDKGVKLCE